MEKYIYDEKNGLWYELQGDYYIPCLKLSEEEQQPIGVWGQRHLRHIKQNSKVLYLNLLTSGKLNGYLADLDKQAEDMFFRLVKQMQSARAYTLHILDDLIDETVRDIFSKMKGVSKSDVIKLRYADEFEVRKSRHNMLKADYSKEFENLTILKSEVIKAIKGESSFSADTLSELIAESEIECNRLLTLVADAEKDVADGEILLKNLSDSFDELISWAELYEEASFEKKKMIVNYLIKRVEVSRGYNLKVEFNIDFEQFMVGIDKVA